MSFVLIFEHVFLEGGKRVEALALHLVPYAVSLVERLHPLALFLLGHIVEPSGHRSVLRMDCVGVDAVIAAVVHHAAHFLEEYVLVVSVVVGDVQAAVAVVVAEKYLCFHDVFF